MGWNNIVFEDTYVYIYIYIVSIIANEKHGLLDVSSWIIVESDRNMIHKLWNLTSQVKSLLF